MYQIAHYLLLKVPVGILELLRSAYTTVSIECQVVDLGLLGHLYQLDGSELIIIKPASTFTFTVRSDSFTHDSSAWIIL